MIELFRTSEFYIFVKGEHSLWWDRNTGAFIPKSGWDLPDADDPICLGICYGIIGKVEHIPLFDSRLLLIKDCDVVGKLHGENEIFRIKSIAFLSLSKENIPIELKPCNKHSQRVTNTNPLVELQKNTFSKTWGTLKSAGNTIKNTTQQAAAIASGHQKREIKDKDKFQKQIVDEFHKIFTDTNSFYYSHTTDLTNSLQRLCYLEKHNLIDKEFLWKSVDDKFFWNKHMLGCLLNSENPLFDPWILPIIQGFIQIEDCKVDVGHFVNPDDPEKRFEIFTICLLSRRSRFRAGTRYKRRGVDEDGEVANYVETEQILRYQNHEVSFVQIRGSAPMFWSQPGYKYRPPPRLDKGVKETCLAFEKHFCADIKKYGPVCAINLVDQSGNEKVVFDAYSEHMLLLDSPSITYVTFDFHEYCKGMHFENVSILINALMDIIKDMNYCWRDKQGHICSQNGIFRVNCIDCLDRTNVVQTAIGKTVMEMQFCKLGLVSPEGEIPLNIKRTFQVLWANNGDTISKQYAGTNALKGDYTRTGERKFTGIMKDGMNSANRYITNHFKDSLRQCTLDIIHGIELREYEIQDFWAYLRVMSCIADEWLPTELPTNYAPHFVLQQEFDLAALVYQTTRYYLSRFKDSTRQGTIDIMLGNDVTEDAFIDTKSNYEEDCLATAEHVKLLIEDCKKMLINRPELVVGAWGLINADPHTGDPNETEIDSILILTRDSYYVADYDDQVDKITKYQKVELKDIELLECGMQQFSNLFKSNKNKYCFRVNYKVNGVSGYFHMFRSSQLRFFNNMAIVIKSTEEETESLKTICEAFSVAIDIANLRGVQTNMSQTLEKKKSKVIQNESSSGMNIYLDLVNIPQISRNVSETQLSAIKNAGSKAISNVTQQFSKLNKINFKSKLKGKSTKNFTIGKPIETSSDSDDESEHSIFQPQPTSNNSASNSSSIEQGLECVEGTVLTNDDVFLPNVGIVMKQSSRNELFDNGQANQEQDAENASLAPQIQVNSKDLPTLEPKLTTPMESTLIDQRHSHSSSEIDDPSLIIEYKNIDRSASDYEILCKNVSQSISDSGIKTRLNATANPGGSGGGGAKEFFSPFSKLAKGVQQGFGATLDPIRKLGGQIGHKHVTVKDIEEQKKLQEKWAGKKCRLIAL